MQVQLVASYTCTYTLHELKHVCMYNIVNKHVHVHVHVHVVVKI